MLVISRVVKRHKNSTFTLSGIDLEIGRGEFVFLTGDTGSGKSTLLGLIYGKDVPDEGDIIFDGITITNIRYALLQRQRRKMGLIFQEDGLVSDKTVFENVAYPLYISGTDKNTVVKRTGIALRLTGIAKKQDMYPEQLSGGEKQKACIARAVVNDPMIILADEPTSNIDKKASREIMEILQRINLHGVTMIIATHELQLADEFAGRIIRLEDGRIVHNEYRMERD